MGKFWVIIIIGIIVIGLAFYYKPDKTKETLKDTANIAGDIVDYFRENKSINLGKPTIPCVDNHNCNENIPDCDGNCTCVSGDCIKNI